MIVKLPALVGGPVSVAVAAPAGGGGSAGGLGAMESGGSATAGAKPALSSQSAANVAAQARTTWRQDQRIEAVYDRDHCIGHAYFTPLVQVVDEDERFVALAQVFRNRILPLLEELGMGEDEDLCGLHTGTPLTERGATFDLDFPDRLMLFRGPIMDQAGFPDDGGTEDDLRREIHITLLHELGHHFGLGEEDLERLGYA